MAEEDYTIVASPAPVDRRR